MAVPSTDAFDRQRRAAMDAFVAHERLRGDPKRWAAQLGEKGYAQALALAPQRADAAEAGIQGDMDDDLRRAAVTVDRLPATATDEPTARTATGQHGDGENAGCA